MNNCLIDKAVSINLLPFYIFSYVSSVSEMLVDGLLWSDVGQSLLKVVGIGIEIVDKLFAVHGR
jgi:xanthine dehydrogenase molybdopterin-binding subunit B